jgi:dTDP-4-dehydrorhamnose 3,5-epimerase-like enzyme
MKPLEFQPVKNLGDQRGDSYSIPQEAIDFVGQIDEIHFATILPNAVRGNHYHCGKREATVLVFSDKCRLAWKPLEAKDSTHADFEGKDSIMFNVQPNVVHAIKNTGAQPMSIISFSNKRHDPENPDTFREIIL